MQTYINKDKEKEEAIAEKLKRLPSDKAREIIEKIGLITSYLDEEDQPFRNTDVS